MINHETKEHDMGRGINLNTLKVGDTIYADQDHNGMLDSTVVAIDRDAWTITVEYDGEHYTTSIEEMLEHGDSDTPCQARIDYRNRRSAR